MRVWLRFSRPGEHLREELTGSTSVDVFAPWSKSCFQDPCPLWQSTDVAVHARFQLGNRENWKAAGPSCAVSKADSEPGSILPSPNFCKYSCRWIVQAASVCLVLRNLSSPQSFPKLSAKPRLDFTCSYAYNFRAGLMISGRSHARTTSSDGSDPKTRLNVTLPAKPLLEFQLHLTLMTVGLGRCSLLPTPHKKRSAQALQATKGKKTSLF